MIISNHQIRNLLIQYSKQNTKVTPNGKIDHGKEGKSGADTMVVSQNAQAYLTAKEAINRLPDIREEMVANIESRIKSGNYQVKDEEIAEKMLGRSLVDKMV